MAEQKSLGDRMKEYEACFKQILPARLPIIIRVDGKGFSKYTSSLEKPIDNRFVNVMNQVGVFLCENIQGAKLAYIQSDEISILVIPYENINSDCWFGGSIQKIVSISAAMASSTFTMLSNNLFGEIAPAYFDSRVFILPKEEVCNYFIFRQQDATRNSIQSLARSMFSHKQCNNKNCNELQELIFSGGKNWNDCPTFQKQGRCLIKEKKIISTSDEQGTLSFERNIWVVDNEIPIFVKDRNYIDCYL